MNRGYLYTNRIDRRAAGESVLDFYCTRYAHSTPEEWRARIERGAVRVNGALVTADTRLCAGQTLTYERAPWREPEVPTDFAVLHEDTDILAIDKPSGLPVLPGGHHLEGTLLALVRRRFGGGAAGGIFAPSPLHRLGRATSGVVLFARTHEAFRCLSAAFRERRVTKIYRALVVGADFPVETTVDVPIGPVPYAPTGRLYAATAAGAPSLSTFRRLETDTMSGRALVEVQIATGRAHQIRIHAAAIGHPLVGDPLYVSGGGPAEIRAGGRPPLPGDCGYYLHAMRIAFRHPRSDEPMEIVSTPPRILRTAEELAAG